MIKFLACPTTVNNLVDFSYIFGCFHIWWSNFYLPNWASKFEHFDILLARHGIVLAPGKRASASVEPWLQSNFNALEEFVVTGVYCKLMIQSEFLNRLGKFLFIAWHAAHLVRVFCILPELGQMFDALEEVKPVSMVELPHLDKKKNIYKYIMDIFKINFEITSTSSFNYPTCKS